MRIQSLNVAMPGLIEYKGEAVMTGINKLPTEAALMVRRLNIDGDAQAGAGGDLHLTAGDRQVRAFDHIGPGDQPGIMCVAGISHLWDGGG